MVCTLEPVSARAVDGTDPSTDTQPTPDTLKKIDQQLQHRVAERLADAEWHRDKEFYDLIPDSWADAELATCSPGARACHADPRYFARVKIVARTFEALRQQGGFEFQRRQLCDEIRLSSIAPPSDLPKPMTSVPALVATNNIVSTPSGPTESPISSTDDPPVADQAPEVPTVVSHPSSVDAKAPTTNPLPPKQPAGVGTGRRIEHRGEVFIIDSEFAALLGDLDPDEKKQLEDNIRKDKRIRDPIVRCKSSQILMGGHHRLELAVKHDLDISVVDLDIPDRAACKQWIVDDQLGRRNLTPDRLLYYRGQIFNLVKHTRGGNRKAPVSKGQNVPQRTDERLGKAFGVSGKTMQRAGNYAHNIDTIAKNCGAAAKQTLLGKQAPLTQKQVAEVAKLAPKTQPAALKKAIENKQRPTGTNKATEGQKPKAKKGPKPGAQSLATDVVIVVADEAAAQAQAILTALGEDRAVKFHLALGQLLRPVLEKRKPNNDVTTDLPQRTGGDPVQDTLDEGSEHQGPVEADKATENEPEPTDDETPPAPAKPYLGIEYWTITPELRKRQGLTCRSGVFINRVASNSPAEVTGLCPRDVIVAVNGTTITEREQVGAAIHQAGVGNNLSLKIKRDKRSINIVVPVAARPTG